MKVISKKDIVILLISLPIIVIIAIVSWFYFAPIPDSLERISKSAVEVKRCIYSSSVSYYATFELTTLQQSSIERIMYNSEGIPICTSSGMIHGEKKEPCKHKLCLPVYEN